MKVKMKTFLVILLCSQLLNVVTARYTNMMPSRLKRDTEDPKEEMLMTENDDLSRLPFNLGTLEKTSDMDNEKIIQDDLLVLPPPENQPIPEENKNEPPIEPKDKEEIMTPEENLHVASDIVIENKMPYIPAEDRLPGFVPPEEVPLGIVVKEPLIVPVEPILLPPVPEMKPVPVIVPEELPPPPPPLKIPLLKDFVVHEPLILPVKPILLPPVVPVEEPVPPPPPAVPEVELPPPPVALVEEPVPPPPLIVPEVVPPPPPIIPELVPLPPPPLKIPLLEEVVFKPPDFTTPFAKGTRWALYFSNMFLKAFSQVLASAQVTISKFAELATP